MVKRHGKEEMSDTRNISELRKISFSLSQYKFIVKISKSHTNQNVFLMRTYLFLLAFLHATFVLIAQKKPLDYSAARSWPILDYHITISNSGKFVCYMVSSTVSGKNWMIEATDHLWKRQIGQIKDLTFTADSRWFIFINNNDSLGILDLQNNNLEFTKQVESFKVPIGGNGKWLGYYINQNSLDFVLLDLFTKNKNQYSGVKDFNFDNNGNDLVLAFGLNDTNKNDSLVWINLLSGFSSIIDRNINISQLVFDESGKLLVFSSDETVRGNSNVVLKYYRPGMGNASILVDSSTVGMKGMAIENVPILLSKNGDKIFFRVNKREVNSFSKLSDNSVSVKVKNYQVDAIPEGLEKDMFWVVTSIKTPGNVIPLWHYGDFRSYYLNLNENCNSDNALIEGIPIKGSNRDKTNNMFLKNLYLVSTSDGSRKLIKSKSILFDVEFSLTGKYVMWYDAKGKSWATYRIADGGIKNITYKIRTPLYEDRDNLKEITGEEGLAGWLENDSAVLIYDRNDIWEVDPDGMRDPINITQGFGRRNNIRFRYMDFKREPYSYFNNKHPTPIFLTDTMLLSSFDIVTKTNGFYSLTLKKNGELRNLITNKHIYYYPYRYKQVITGICDPFFPVKAKMANAFILQRMNIDEYPNLYFTNDFKNFKRITDFEPQKKYLWYSSDLIHFSLSNGLHSEGILYKPENFDPRKKYPVIFYYYEKNADELHWYIHPQLSVGALNIPWFVSNGYLVFVPDILYYKAGHPGECAYQTVIAASNILSKLPFVNSNAMGLQGHSYGGWETNYIVTRTGRFAAAASSAGACDLISMNSQSNLHNYYEAGQGRIGISFWKNAKLYIENSPIFMADKVSTPLLLMHNQDDRSVPYIQGKEWYNGLTYLKKKVWMLSYEGEGHVIENDEHNQLDYSIRLAQFFDYYLKGALPPNWMTEGGTSLELDSSGRKP